MILPPRSEVPDIVNVEVPADLEIVPSKSKLAKVCIACKSSVAPLAMIRSVAALTAPVSLMVPLEIVVSPEYVFVPDKVRVPAPVLSISYPFDPSPIAVEIVSCVPSTSIVEFAPNVITPARAEVPVDVLKVPPLLVIASVVE